MKKRKKVRKKKSSECRTELLITDTVDDFNIWKLNNDNNCSLIQMAQLTLNTRVSALQEFVICATSHLADCFKE